MRLGSKNLHYRSWKWKENELTINDNITGFYKEAIGRFFLHPLISILNDSKRNTYFLMTTRQHLFILINEIICFLDH